jgi:Flp pilus assembly protein TadG
MRIRRQVHRRGASTVELAVLLPFLALLFVIALDWSRLFYAAVVIDNCARNAAMYASDPYSTTQSPYSSVTAAALADAPNLTPQPTVTTTSGVDASGLAYVDCTVSYNFQTLTNFPGVPQNTTLVRTVRAYVAPQAPQ